MQYQVFPFVYKCNALGSVDAIDDTEAMKKAKAAWPHVKHPILVCDEANAMRWNKDDARFWEAYSKEYV